MRHAGFLELEHSRVMEGAKLFADEAHQFRERPLEVIEGESCGVVEFGIEGEGEKLVRAAGGDLGGGLEGFEAATRGAIPLLAPERNDDDLAVVGSDADNSPLAAVGDRGGAW